MIARVVRVQLLPGKTEEATSLFRDSVVPAAKQQPGFVSITLFTDEAAGKGMSVSVWASEADMKTNEASGYYQEQIAKFGSLLSAPPVIETYAVGVQS